MAAGPVAVRRIVPRWFGRLLRRGTLPWRISRLLSAHLPQLVCVDAGAAYFPHARWLLFLNSPRTHWLAVEPNQAATAYLDAWEWPCRVKRCALGLSRDGGAQTLFVTNVDSGSSLLPPEIPASMQHRIGNPDYYFPVTERPIDTLTLERALADLPRAVPVFVKLDTQGTELSILQGAGALFDAHAIVGIEMESTLLAQPVMRGSGKFWQACAHLEERGFELLLIEPMGMPPRSAAHRAGTRTCVNECDAVFALRRDIARGLAVEYRAALLGFYLTNLLHEEAVALLDADAELERYLASGGCAMTRLRSALRAAPG